MQTLVKMASCALLMLPALSFAITVDNSASGVVPLLAWELSPWGTWAALAIVILGGIAGTPVGTPWPFLDGAMLAGGFIWLPPLCEGSPPFVQNVVAVLLLVWASTFIVMFFRLLKPWREWDTFSFLEVSFGVYRIIRRNVKTAVGAKDSTR